MNLVLARRLGVRPSLLPDAQRHPQFTIFSNRGLLDSFEREGFNADQQKAKQVRSDLDRTVWRVQSLTLPVGERTLDDMVASSKQLGSQKDEI